MNFNFCNVAARHTARTAEIEIHPDPNKERALPQVNPYNPLRWRQTFLVSD
jgi:hypothetical protein